MTDRHERGEKIEFVFLIRSRPSEQGTKGFWITKNFECCSLELPWRNNAPNISCIPARYEPYEVKMRHSRKFGWCYWITDVEGRTWILSHSGNLAGMVDKGYLTHTHGCVLLGRKFGYIRGQRAVLISKPTVKAFQNYMREEPFYLNIINAYEGGGY